jgi:hypothetical protein
MRCWRGASTYPLQVIATSRWLEKDDNKNLKGDALVKGRCTRRAGIPAQSGRHRAPKDLGRNTARIAAATGLFDPDLSWARVDVVND